MNDDRFIEQLNLYIDQELPAEEARELEAELAANPERQQTYLSYCRLQHGCRALDAPHSIPRPSVRAIVEAAESPDNVADFPTPQPAFGRPAEVATATGTGIRWNAGLSGLVAAAFAVALYVGGNFYGSSPDLAEQPAPSASMAESTENSDAVVKAGAYQTVLSLDSFVRSQGEGREANVLHSSEDPFAWMDEVQFEPIRTVDIDSLEFRADEPLEKRNLSAYSYPYPGLDDTPPKVETTAFQFQR